MDLGGCRALKLPPATAGRGWDTSEGAVRRSALPLSGFLARFPRVVVRHEDTPYEPLDAIIRMSEGISFATSSDPERADRAMGASGEVALVAIEDDEPVDFWHSVTDGALRAGVADPQGAECLC